MSPYLQRPLRPAFWARAERTKSAAQWCRTRWDRATEARREVERREVDHARA